ncbi:MAG: hypothetical protein KGN00_12755 [Chloroflexota bacterium]|nr:hypothetical protein [Chloroflexota bacterium]
MSMLRVLLSIRPAALVALGALVISCVLVAPATAQTSNTYIYGTVTDAQTHAPLGNVCVILGPSLVNCTTRTAADGTYEVDFPPNNLITAQQQLHFLAASQGYQQYDSPQFQVIGATRQDAAMWKVGATPTLPCDLSGTPTQTVYLPNITKTLGGADGWDTPFIVQNVGAAATNLEVSYYTFATGALVLCQKIQNLRPSASFADIPDKDTFLSDNSQFSVVVQSFGANVVSVINEQAGKGDLSEAMSYDGYSTGSSSVFLPNVTRRFFGYDTPFIIQNLGSSVAQVQAHFVSFDGSVPEVTSQRTIQPGRSQPIDPNWEPGLVDGHQYAVTVTGNDPLGVVINSQADAAGTAHPVAYSQDGLVSGGTPLYGAYAAKNAQGVGRVSTIVVQNMGTATVDPTLAFTPLAGSGAGQSFDLGPIAPGAGRPFDPHYANGDVKQAVCGSSASTTCLADGEFSFILSASPTSSGGTPPPVLLAADVNVISPTTAMGYTATATASRRMYLPNVTRTLGGASGWTTPILVQSATATAGQLSFYRFTDQTLVLTQPITLTPGGSIRIDPRDLATLSDDTQYSVVVDGADGTLSAIVTELASGGDNAMAYEGFPAQ